MSSAKSQRQLRFLKGMEAPTFRKATAKEIAEVMRWVNSTNKINTNKKEK